MSEDNWDDWIAETDANEIDSSSAAELGGAVADLAAQLGDFDASAVDSDAASAQASLGDAADSLDAAGYDLDDAKAASEWAEWNGQIADDAAFEAELNIDAAENAYAIGDVESAQQYLETAEVASENADNADGAATDYSTQADASYADAASDLNLAGDSMIDAGQSLEASSYDANPYDASIDTSTDLSADTSIDTSSDSSDV